MIEALVLAGAIGTGLVLARRYPDATIRWFRRIRLARQAILAGLSLLFSLLFIGSGVIPLMAIGFLGFVYTTILVVYEKPHEEIRAWIR